MTLTPLIIDIAAAAIIIFSALRGRHRGLIKTLAGILALILAFSAAGFLAKETAPYVSEKYVSPYISSAVAPETERLTDAEAATNPSVVSEIFLNLGISEHIVSDAVSDFTDAISKSIMEPIAAMTNSVAYKITYAVLFVIFFILSLLILSVLFKILNLASKIPGLNFINKTLGLILGLILGYLIVVVLSYIMLKLGIFLTDDIIRKTYILEFVMNFSPASLISVPEII